MGEYGSAGRFCLFAVAPQKRPRKQHTVARVVRAGQDPVGAQPVDQLAGLFFGNDAGRKLEALLQRDAFFQSCDFLCCLCQK